MALAPLLEDALSLQQSLHLGVQSIVLAIFSPTVMDLLVMQKEEGVILKIEGPPLTVYCVYTR